MDHTRACPGWLDFDSSFYGHGLVEPHGMKVSNDREGEEVEPGARPERASDASVARSAEYLARRFPALAGAQLRSAPVCHYSLTADGGFLFARHPRARARLAARRRLGPWLQARPRHCRAGGRACCAARPSTEPRFALGAREPSRALRTAGS